MKLERLFLVTLLFSGLFSLFVSDLAAQMRGNIIWAEYQMPRPGRQAQYEEARKEKAKWHREENDNLPIFVWEVLTGKRTGQYLVATSAKEWKDLDKTKVSLIESKDRFMELFKNDVVKVQSFFMDHLVEISRGNQTETPSPMAVLRFYKIAYGKWGDFYNLLRKFKEAAEFGDWEQHYNWFSVNNGVEEPMFVQSIPKQNWADMEPPKKAPLQLAMDLFGPQDTISMTELMSEIIEGENSEILRYRPDLSYLPEGSQ